MSPRRTRRRVLAAVGSALFAGCTGLPGTGPTPTSTASPEPVRSPDGTATPREDWTAPTDAPSADVEPNVLVENLEVPWDVSVAPSGDLFVSERVGRITRFASGDLETVLAPEDAIDAGSLEPGSDERPWWVDGGEGGTLGIALHPDYPDAPYLFVYYTAQTTDGRRNRISRFDVGSDDPAGTEEVLVGGIPANNFHNGGRLAFGPGGYLWATTGDAGEKAAAADPGSLAGKVLRITVDGEPAPGNPGLEDPRVFTYGHRNPQGVVWLPDGTPLANEHGPQARDEVNRLVAGDDYGWPDARNPDEYRAADGVHPPLVNTGNSTTWAPTGSLFYTGDAMPSWGNRMLIGGLISQQLVVLTVTPPDGDPPPAGDGRRFDADWMDDAYTATAHTVLKNELGRIRHVEQGLDGELYVVTSNRDGRAKQPFPRERDDVLVRLEPA